MSYLFAKKGSPKPGGAASKAKVPLLAGSRSSGDAETVLSHQQDRFRSMLEEFMGEQRSQQERFIDSLLKVHVETLQEIKRITPIPPPSSEIFSKSRTDDDGLSREGSALEATDQGEPAVDSARPEDSLPAEDSSPADSPRRNDDGYTAIPSRAVTADTSDADLKPVKLVEDQLKHDERVMENWVRCNGLHTVEDWVADYENHPAGWAALLMIHGIPEVTGRLRSKVDNFSIYSALFLSMSVMCLAAPADTVLGEVDVGAEDSSVNWWVAFFRKRVYLYGFGIGTCLHTLCILIGMAFNGALNEAARDSDVFRMFAQGKGFLATVKSETAFMCGCAADYVAVLAGVSYILPWTEVLIGASFMILAAWWVYRDTKDLLYSTTSIVNYWRRGSPPASDPFDLHLTVECFHERAKAARHIRKTTVDAHDGASLGSGNGKRRTARESGMEVDQQDFVALM